MRILMVSIAILFASKCFAQNDLTLQQAIQIARKNNLAIAAASSEVESQRQLKKTAFDLPKTNAILMHGQYNSFKNDNNITITQTIPFTAFGSRGALNRSMLASAELKQAVTENELIYQVKQVYLTLAFAMAKQRLLLQQDSLYQGFFKAAAVRYRAGEGKLLEKVTAESQQNETRNQLMVNEADISVLRTQLKTLLNSQSDLSISIDSLTEIHVEALPDTTFVELNPSLAFQRQQVDLTSSQKKFERASMAPDFVLGYFNQTLIDAINIENGSRATQRDRFTGIQAGISIPIWFAPYQGRVKSAEYRRRAAEQTYEYEKARFTGELQAASQRFAKSKNSLQYYKESALRNAELILKQSLAAFQGGDIEYSAYLLSVRNALSIKENYLLTLNEYNQSIIYIEFLSGNR